MSTQLKVKTADTSRASDATPSADPDLVITLDANSVYLIHCDVFFYAGATGQFKAGFKSDATLTHASLKCSVHNPSAPTNNYGPGNGSTRLTKTEVAAGSAVAIAGSATSTDRGVYKAGGIVQVGSSGGTLSFWWSQNVSNATATTLIKGSFLRAQKLRSTDRYLIKSTKENRANTPGTYEDDSELVDFALDAGRVYWLDVGIIGGCIYYYAHRFNYQVSFSGTVSAESFLHFTDQWSIYPNEWDTGSGYGSSVLIDQITYASQVDSLGDNTANTGGFPRVNGIVRINAGGTLKLGWYKTYNGAGPADTPVWCWDGSYFAAIDITDGILG